METNLGAIPQLLDLLYEVLARPERWRHFLDELCRLLRCEMVALALHDLENREHVLRFSVGLPDEAVQEWNGYWNGYYGTRNTKVSQLRRTRPRTGFSVSASISDVPGAMQDTEYVHWLRRRDLCHWVVAVVPSRPQGIASLSLMRPESAGPFSPAAAELVRKLLPHLQRTFEIQGRLETLRAYSDAGKLALDRLDAGFVAVDASGCVVLMNQRPRRFFARGTALRSVTAGWPLWIPGYRTDWEIC
jgi:hypothetical protein